MYHRQYTGGPLDVLSPDRGFPSGKSPMDFSRPMSDDEWREANRALADSLSSISLGAQHRLRTLAEKIAQGIALLDPIYDRYCEASYPRCDEVCCEVSQVYYHFTDLLLIHALGASPPPHQTRTRPKETCRYLGSRGCTLPRMFRPYLCTWYMCELHLECFFGESPREQRRILRAMEVIKEDKDLLAGEYAGALDRSRD